MNSQQTLKRFGLVDNEIKVYLEILKHDELSPFQISKLTNVARTTVYDALMSLSLKGLIELQQSDGLQKQQTKVKPKNPSVLRKLIWQRRDRLTELEADIAQILPELKAHFHKDAENDVCKFYPGIEGLKEVYLMSHEGESDIAEYFWTNLIPLDALGSEVINTDVSRSGMLRTKLNLRAKELIPLNDWTRHVLSYQFQRDPNYLDYREFRYIDNPIFNMYLDMGIRGNYVRISCAEGEEVWGLVIRSKALADSFKSIYEFMWQQAKPVTVELIKSFGQNEFLAAQKQKGYLRP